MEGECLGCGTEFDYEAGECPACGWSIDEFREHGRHGLEKTGHCEPEDSGGSGGPPPGLDGLRGL